MNMTKILTSKNLTTVATGMAGTVYITTALKAVGRPAFIYADKKSDAETKKYTAGKEFLYQVLCLGLTVAMLPGFKTLGSKLADLYIKKAGKAGKTIVNPETVINGGKQLGYLVGSVLGLTIIAPLLSHEILHPIMKFLGMEKKPKDSKDIGKPQEVFVADAKVPAQPAAKVNTVV